MKSSTAPKPLNEIKLFLLDMDGTVYLGDRLFPSVIPFLQKLRESGRGHLYLTNNSSKDRSEYFAKLERLGIPSDDRHLMTSGDVTAEYLVSHFPRKRVYLVGTPALRRAFLLSGIPLARWETADVAVMGFDTGLHYKKLNGLYQMVRSGKPYICTHPDLVCPTDGGFIPDIGAAIAYIKALTGRAPDTVIGKPERNMIDAAAARFNVDIASIAMVGDRLYTDMEMANRVGAVSILVLSGETTPEMLAAPGSASPAKLPDYVFPDLSGITALL